MLAGRQNRGGAVPLVGQVENRIDVIAGREGPKSVDRRGVEGLGRAGRQMSYLLADATHFKPVG